MGLPRAPFAVIAVPHSRDDDGEMLKLRESFQIWFPSRRESL